MVSLVDLAQRILKVRQLIDEIEVKGSQNRNAVCSAYEICGTMLEDIRDTLEQIKMEAENDQAGEIKDGDG